MKKFTKITLAAIALTLSPLTFAQNDVTGVVGDYYVRDVENGAESRFYFRLNGGVSESESSLESCMGASAGDMTWDINVTSAVAAEMMALVKKSREEMKPIRVLGTHTVCDGGGAEYGDTAFEIMPNWQPGAQ